MYIYTYFCFLQKKKKRHEGGESGRPSRGSEEWSDPWARQTRAKYKKKRIGEVLVCGVYASLTFHSYKIFHLFEFTYNVPQHHKWQQSLAMCMHVYIYMYMCISIYRVYVNKAHDPITARKFAFWYFS